MLYLLSSRKAELGRLATRLAESVYEGVGDLDVTAWVTPEPVAYARRTRGAKRVLKAGDKWGDLFDCAWMQMTGKVPAAAAGKMVVLLIDVNGEACVVNDKGEPVQGLTNINSDYDYSLGKPGKRVVPFARRARGGEKLSLWIEAGCNDLFGRLRGGGTLKEARFAIRHPNLYQLQYDFEVLEELMRQLPESSARYQQILYALSQVANVLQKYTDQEAKEAIAILKPQLAMKGGDSSLTLSAIGHSHMDLAWLWPIRETKRKCARTFSTALRMMERFPDYVYGASQPQQYQWTKENYPSLYRQIKKRVAEGRWDLQGGMWVEADTNIPSGESLVRQFLYGQRFWREEFSAEVTDLWLPDVFGYSGALPQIMAGCGVKYFMTQKLSWNQVNSFPHQSFWWQGIDGTKVLAHMLPEETYNSPGSPRSLAKAERNYKDSAVSRHALVLFGIGDGGGGPGEEHLERLAREKNLAGLCPLVQERAGEFFAKWEKDAKQFATWQGELYLEKHQGTLTTQARNKRFNRKLELALRDCEMLASFGLQAKHRYPQSELAAIWKEVLLYQFHDIIPGSSITRVYAECLPRYEQLLRQTLELSADAEKGLLGRIDTSAARSPVVVFNSLSWERCEWVKLSGQWTRVTVPSCGFAVVDEAQAGTNVGSEAKCSERELENDVLRLRFAADGSISSVYDKRSGQEFLEQAGNRLAIWADPGDAWDFSMSYREREPEYMKLASSQAYVDGPIAGIRQRYTYGESQLLQDIRLVNGSCQVDFVTHVDWRENARMLRTSFPTNLRSREAMCEIQYGAVARPTHANTAWDAAKIEVNAHKWVDISDTSRGVALLNDCKYGYRVSGGEIDLNLLRSPGGPDPLADRAEHDFTYSLLPHDGNHITGGVVRAAYGLNVPLRITRTTAHQGAGSPGSLIEVNSPHVIVETVKKAEDTDDIIIRLYECHGGSARTKLKLNLPHTSVAVVNMLEEQPKRVAARDGVVELEFGPYEIKTLRVGRH